MCLAGIGTLDIWNAISKENELIQERYARSPIHNRCSVRSLSSTGVISGKKEDAQHVEWLARRMEFT